jgi:hypothetical protein
MGLAGGRFDLIRPLGRGGMGAVYEVFDRERDITVALKTLLTMGPQEIAILKNEFRVLADVHHQNLVTLGELLEHEGSWFFTMELVRGSDFLEYVCPGSGVIRSTVPGTDETVDTAVGLGSGRVAVGVPRPRAAYDEARLRDALAQLARGLGALHVAGKVHRDVKPSNILVTEDGRLVLLDFGIVTDTGRQGLEGTGPLVGTVAYMAPEQIQGERLGAAADCYAVGVLLYQALTGLLPYRGTYKDVLAAKCERPPVPPGQLVAGIPPQLGELCMQLLARDPGQRPRVDGILRALGQADDELSHTSTRGGLFVGRGEELARLQGLFERSCGGEAVAAFVCGASGLGKSSLVNEFARRVADPGRDAIVLRGRCYEREAVPYKGVDSIIDALVGHLVHLPEPALRDLLPADVALLPALFPALARLPGVAGPAAGAAPLASRTDDAQEQRRRAFLALRALLSGLSRSRRLVLLLDDLQWTDGDGLALLATLLEPPAVPLLLVCSVRTEPDNPAVRTPRALATALACPVEMLELGRLGDTEARALLSHLGQHATGDGKVDPAAILKEAEGHPLFLDTLLRFHRARAQSAGPVRLEDALRARVDRLPAAGRNLLEIVALFGKPLSYEVAAAATALPLDEIERQVALLRGSNLLRGRSAERRVEPYHDRVREAAVSAMAVDARRMAHSRLALALEYSNHPEPDVLGLHWREAGQPARAAEWFARAGDRAQSALAFDQAARLYQMALEDAVDPPLVLRTKLAFALASTGQGQRAAEVYLDASRRTSGDEALELRRRAMEQLIRCGHIDEGLALVEELLRPFDIRFPRTPHAALGSVLVQRARLAMRGFAYRSRREGEIPPTELRRIDLLWGLGYGLAMVHSTLSAGFTTRALLAALDVGEPSRVARSLALESALVNARHLKYRRRGQQIRQLAEKAAAESGDPLARAWAFSIAGTSAFQLGQFREAMPRLEESRAYYGRCTNVSWEESTLEIYILWNSYYLGDLGDLEQQLWTLCARAQSQGNLMLLANLAASPGAASSIHLLRDRPEQAGDELEGVMRQWSQSGFHLQHFYETLSRASILIYQGQGQAAWELLERRSGDLRRSLLLSIHYMRVETLFARGRAALCAALAGTGPARQRLLRQASAAARDLERERNDWSDLYAALVRGGVECASGRDAVATDHFTRACAIADKTGMALHGAVARFALGHCLGGPDGGRHQEDALTWLRAGKVAAPGRFVASMVPGCGGAAA